jgi:hypothetical protein
MAVPAFHFHKEIHKELTLIKIGTRGSGDIIVDVLIPTGKVDRIIAHALGSNAHGHI